MPKGSLPKEWERDRHTDRVREQESPYIAHRKSCVRAGSSFFGHGGFLAGWKTDISSTGWLLDRGSHEGLREAAGVVVMGRQLGRARLALWFQLQHSLHHCLLCSVHSPGASNLLLQQTLYRSAFLLCSNDSIPHCSKECNMTSRCIPQELVSNNSKHSKHLDNISIKYSIAAMYVFFHQRYYKF